MAVKQESVLTDFVCELGVIPFNKARGDEFDLLWSATVHPHPGSARVADIGTMHAGFTTEFFSLLQSDDNGEQDLQSLLGSVCVMKQQPLIGVSESANANSGHVGLHFAAMIGASATGATSSVEETRYSLTDVETHSLEGSPLLVPFLQKHLPTFAKNVPALQFTFSAEPTKWSGSIDKVVAIVTTKVTGKAEIYRDAARTTSGEAKVAAAQPVAPAARVDVGGGFGRSSSQKDQQNERGGILGASFCLVHLCKSWSSGDVKALSPTIVKRADDPNLVAFLRLIKLKEFKKLVTDREVASLGFLTEKKSEMDKHNTLDDHVAKMNDDRGTKMKAARSSLAVGGWDDGHGVVNLKIAKGNTMELHESQRVPDGTELRHCYEASWNFIFSAPREYLSKMYQDLKEGKTVQVAGRTVEAMSPAFTVDISGFLPIYFFGGDGGEGHSEVPGAVVRDFDDDTAFIFPVEGCGTNRSCATVYSDDWEVRESIVRASRSDNEQTLLLTQRGFHAIEFVQSRSNDDEIVMGRHQLARVGDPLDDGNGVFRVPPAEATGAAAAVTGAGSVPSAAEGNPTKKQKS